MSKLIFIGGTSTDIGKTFITNREYKTRTQAGNSVAIIKPVQTGTDFYNSDIATIYANYPNAMRLHPNEEIPFHFKFPASPAAAARYESRPAPTIEEIVKSIQNTVKDTRFDTFLIEAAGGLMVPLNDTEFMIDLPKALNCSVILVTETGLGMLNHVILSIEALERRLIQIEKIVFNRFPKEVDFIAQDNLFEISRRYPHITVEVVHSEN